MTLDVRLESRILSDGEYMTKTKTDALAKVVILYNYYKSWSDQERQDADSFTATMVDGLREQGHTVAVCEFWKDVKPAIKKFKPSEWIVFNWCEGIEDEVGGDARICADLDTLGYTYTGNTPWTLKISVEKGRAKRMLERWEIPTPPGREFKTPEDVKEWAHFPAIVKPVSQHCSVAVTRDAVVHTLEQLRERVAYVNENVKEGVIAEQFVAGREINIGIWGNGRPKLLPLREIDFSRVPNPLHQMVTWDSKWVPESPEWNSMPVNTEPIVSDALRKRIEEIALKTYRVFDCRDYARIDMRIDENENPFVVDVNPNPDICFDGGFAGACKAAGFSYGAAISNIVSMAVARRNRREALARSLKLREKRESMVPA
jgi:D-alanine-D-alanine ligase